MEIVLYTVIQNQCRNVWSVSFTSISRVARVTQPGSHIWFSVEVEEPESRAGGGGGGRARGHGREGCWVTQTCANFPVGSMPRGMQHNYSPHLSSLHDLQSFRQGFGQFLTSHTQSASEQHAAPELQFGHLCPSHWTLAAQSPVQDLEIPA